MKGFGILERILFLKSGKRQSLRKSGLFNPLGINIQIIILMVSVKPVRKQTLGHPGHQLLSSPTWNAPATEAEPPKVHACHVTVQNGFSPFPHQLAL